MLLRGLGSLKSVGQAGRLEIQVKVGSLKFVGQLEGKKLKGEFYVADLWSNFFSFRKPVFTLKTFRGSDEPHAPNYGRQSASIKVWLSVLRTSKIYLCSNI